MLCKCGCGQETSVYLGKSKDYVTGHNGRGKKRKQYRVHACLQCGKRFETMPHVLSRKFCSCDCRNKFNSSNVGEKNPQYARVDIVCKICGAKFSTIPSRANSKRGTGTYCSMACGREARRRKIVGRSRTRRVLSGKSMAKRLDGFSCLVCGFDSVVAAHHITPRKDGGGNEIANIITLCPNHHYMAHAGLIGADDLRALVAKRVIPVDLLAPTGRLRCMSAVDFRSHTG